MSLVSLLDLGSSYIVRHPLLAVALVNAKRVRSDHIPSSTLVGLHSQHDRQDVRGITDNRLTPEPRNLRPPYTPR